MEILDLRQLRGGDLEALLEEETRVWREQFHWDYSSSTDLIRRFVDSRTLPGYAAIERGRTVGYSFFVYEDYKGLIGNLFVSPPYCGGTEKRLLVHVIETMQETPGVRRIEAQLMTFGAGALEDVFDREHFKTFRRRFMMLDLPCNLPQHPSGTGIDIVPWSERYFEEAASLITRAYRAHVDSEINDQYRSLPGAGRFLRNIIHYPGCGLFHAPGSFLAMDQQTGEVCGMVLTSIVCQGVGHITQICVSPESHGRRIGFHLMCRVMDAFQSSGYTGLSLTVTSANTRAVRLYEQLGFRSLREFSAFVWEQPARFA